MANEVVQVTFNPARCKKEVKEFGKLLKSKTDLSEKKDILPFFRDRDQICSLMGSIIPAIGLAPEIYREFSFLGDYSADLFVGNKAAKHHLAIEFEDARANSILRNLPGRNTKEWSPRFEHGYSQLIDWFATLDDYKKIDKFRREYGQGHVVFSGLLVVGRDSGLTQDDLDRLDWRSDKVLVDSHSISCLTFDGLHRILQEKVELYSAAASKPRKK